MILLANKKVRKKLKLHRKLTGSFVSGDPSSIQVSCKFIQLWLFSVVLLTNQPSNGQTTSVDVVITSAELSFQVILILKCDIIIDLTEKKKFSQEWHLRISGNVIINRV